MHWVRVNFGLFWQRNAALVVTQFIVTAVVASTIIALIGIGVSIGLNLASQVHQARQIIDSQHEKLKKQEGIILACLNRSYIKVNGINKLCEMERI